MALTNEASIYKHLQIRFPSVERVSSRLLGGARRHEYETGGGAVVLEFVPAA